MPTDISLQCYCTAGIIFGGNLGNI